MDGAVPPLDLRTFSFHRVIVTFRPGEPGLHKRAIERDLRTRLERVIAENANKGICAQELAIRRTLVVLAADLPRHRRRRIIAGVIGQCGHRRIEYSLDFGTVHAPRDALRSAGAA